MRTIVRRVGAPRTGRTHGRISTYQSGCRCGACSAVNREKGRARAGLPPLPLHGAPEAYDAGCRCRLCTLEQAYRETEPVSA